MFGFVFWLLSRAALEAVRVCRREREPKPVPLCVGCLHAHVQYTSNARRAISCTYGGGLRPMKLDVQYCTSYAARNPPVRVKTVGFGL